jgi:hypothetical protein
MKNNIVHVSICLFIETLSMILLIATTTVKISFSVMKIVKHYLRNRLRDQLMNDCPVTYTLKIIHSRLLTIKKSCSDFKI